MNGERPTRSPSPYGVLSAARDAVVRLGRGEDGVAFVTTLACFMFMYVMCMGVYAVGTAVREKIQLQNAADAAAYSAAVIQADTISRIAAVNRAMAWTYVQMTRRQMDFIVQKWLDLTLKIYEEDEGNARKWNKLSLLPCDKHHNGGGPRSDTYWCGIDEHNIGLVWVNGMPPDFDEVPVIGKATRKARDIPGLDEIGLGRALSVSDIQRKLSAYGNTYTRLSLPFSGDYLTMLTGDVGQQILFDKANIAAMNVAELHLVHMLKERIEKAVPDILRANLPDRDVASDRVVYRIEQAENHFSSFRYLNNTKEDEKLFCSFAGYRGEPFQIFRGDPLTWQGLLTDPDGAVRHSVWAALSDQIGLNVMNGTDRWFVRGDGKRRAKDSDYGIQRSYKHWAEDLIADDLRLHNSKYIKVKVGGKTLFLPPSNLNFNGDGNEASSLAKYFTSSDVFRSGLPSVGLYSQWQWYSMLWFCTPRFIPFPPFIYWVHESVCPSLFFCDHNDWGLKIDGRNENCIYLPGDVISCRYRSYRKKRWRIKKRTHWSASGKYTDFGIPGFRGYTRVYGDDPAILEKHAEKYVGERCLPLLINPLYFGELGTISVGVARKNENAWARLLGGVVSALSSFSAYEPSVPWSWAFSSAKAGYKDPGAAEASNAYIVDWRGSEDAARWNLFQTDWDAVFVPVSCAKSWASGRTWVDSLLDRFPSLAGYTSRGGAFLERWMLDGEGWTPLAETGKKPSAEVWREVAAPKGMLGESGDLDWKRLPGNLRH